MVRAKYPLSYGILRLCGERGIRTHASGYPDEQISNLLQYQLCLSLQIKSKATRRKDRAYNCSTH